MNHKPAAARHLPVAPIRRLVDPFARFLRIESATGLVKQYGGWLLYLGYLSGADVSVYPRYGRWDTLTGNVVAL